MYSKSWPLHHKTVFSCFVDVPPNVKYSLKVRQKRKTKSARNFTLPTTHHIKNIMISHLLLRSHLVHCALTIFSKTNKKDVQPIFNYRVAN